MKKRILTAFLCVCLLLCFAACDDQQSQTAQGQDTRPDTVVKEKKRSNVMEYDQEAGEYYLQIVNLNENEDKSFYILIKSQSSHHLKLNILLKKS